MTGHIVPKLTIASLLGIQVLCKAGCSVVFTKSKCYVIYNEQVILQGFKDPATNLWTLPGKEGKPHKNPSTVNNSEHINIATFTNFIRT